jgi:hypothetical protein
MLWRSNPLPAWRAQVAGRAGAHPSALPQWIRPQLTRLVDDAPEGHAWLHEIKFDGYRVHARLDRGAVRLLTRTGLDWTHKYPAIAAAVSAQPLRLALGAQPCALGAARAGRRGQISHLDGRQPPAPGGLRGFA